MKKILKIVAFVLIVAALAVGGIKAVKKARAKDASKPVAKIYPITVKTITPKMQDIKLSLPYLAEVANDKDVKLASRIAARIIKIMPSGAKVKKGDVVVRLDTTDIESGLKSVKQRITAAEVALNNLRETHKRTLELLKVQGASIEESQKEATMIANAEAALSGLKQQQIELQNNLSYATILSPVDGTVAKTYANQGALSAPGKPLVAISSKNGFYLMVRVPTDLSVDAVDFNGKTYAATALGSTFHGLAEYKVYTGDTRLISGDRVRVDVVTFHHQGILLPFDAILDRDGQSFVLVADGKHAVAKPVHILHSAEQGIVVSDDLAGKRLVVAKPDIMLKLLSGYALTIKE